MNRLVLIPVIHTDKESIKLAREKVLAIKPDVVAVELDHARYKQLQNPQPITDDEMPFTGDSIADLMNQIAMLEKNLGQLTGAMAGEEMLAAIEAGREIDAKIALVDRPIHITMQALMQIPLTEVYKLAEMIPDASEQVQSDHESIFDMLRDSENVDSMLEEFRKEFPAIASVLIDQRNEYIAKALKSILADVEGTVVAVLGAGHIEGVKRILEESLES